MEEVLRNLYLKEYADFQVVKILGWECFSKQELGKVFKNKLTG